MSRVELSDRLKCIADMVLPGTVVYDVGCDHGFLSIYLVESTKTPRAVALDVREGPLSAASTHVHDAGLSDKIECRLSDGLHNISRGEIAGNKLPTSIVIAGMGGPLILKILEQCPAVRDAAKEIIVGPQSRIEEFRSGIRSQGLYIADEDMVFEDGKYYPIIKLCKKDFDLSDVDKENARINDLYGPVLIEKRHPVLKQFIDYRMRILTEVFNNLNPESHANRYEEVRREIEITQKVLANWE